METNNTIINKDYILDEFMNQVNKLTNELLVKNAFIKQLQEKIKVLESESTKE